MVHRCPTPHGRDTYGSHVWITISHESGCYSRVPPTLHSLLHSDPSSNTTLFFLLLLLLLRGQVNPYQWLQDLYAEDLRTAYLYAAVSPFPSHTSSALS